MKCGINKVVLQERQLFGKGAELEVINVHDRKDVFSPQVIQKARSELQ